MPLHGSSRYHTLLLVSMPALVFAQPYDLVLKGGHVIDPANNIDRAMDVAVAGGRIAQVAADIPERDARRVIAVKGRYVTPGLVDLHTHVYIKGRMSTITPDDAVLPHGTTTIVDAGVSGARTFDDFKATIIDRAKTRVLALINIVATGMHDDQRKEYIVEDMDPAAAAAKIKQYPAILVGVKSAHFGLAGWASVDRAIAAGNVAGVPVMLDSSVYSNSGRDTRTKVLEKMRPGDIHTHCYNDHQLEMVSRFNGKVQPYMFEARKRGVIFDLGHGGGSFLWPVAKAAMDGGFPPDTIGTDLHPGSILTLGVHVPNSMSKLINLGMTLQDAVMRSTVNPAKTIRRFPEIGTLGVGKEADVAVLEMQQGVFAFVDSIHKKLTGTKNVANVMTLRAGKIVFDRDGISLEAARNTPNVAPPPAPGPAPAAEGTEQIFDLLLKNGIVIRPGKGIAKADIGIAGGVIRRIAPRIDAKLGRTVADLDGYYVTPGLIDSQADTNTLDRASAVTIDHHALRHGVTVAVDSNATPASIRRYRTRVLAAKSPDSPALSSGVNSETALEGANLGRTMTLLLNEGVAFDQIVDRATRVPAQALKNPQLARIEVGAAADLAAFELAPASGAIRGPGNRRFEIRKRVECALTVRQGSVVWDLHGLTMKEWSQSGGYWTFK